MSNTKHPATTDSEHFIHISALLKEHFMKRKVSTGVGSWNERTLAHSANLSGSLVKKCEEYLLVNAINAGKCKKLKERIFPNVYKKAMKGYELLLKI